MKYKGGCHCEKVRFEAEMEKVEKAMACNCSICSKKGSLLTFIPAENFTLISGEDSLVDYQFGKKVIHHYFCSNCGVSAFGAGTGPDGKEMRAINVRCLDGIDLKEISVSEFNGKDL